MSPDGDPAAFADAPTLPLPVEGSRHAFVDGVDALGMISGPAFNLAVWCREPHPAFARWLDDACAARWIDASARVLRERSDASAVVADLPEGPWRDVLRRDVEALAAAYARWVELPSAFVQLATVDTDKCNRYHADYIGLRLLCTYSGRGTEWVEDHAVERTSRGPVILDGRAVRSLRRFDVGVLKGNRWRGNDGGGCIHRSPPVARAGERRLLLKIDVG